MDAFPSPLSGAAPAGLPGAAEVAGQERMPVPVIVNPYARSARTARRLEDLQALSPRVELHPTARAGDASRIAEKLARDGVPLIVAAGGDGTVNEVLHGLVRAGTAGRRGNPGSAPASPENGNPAGTVLGVLPAGTMNVFAAELGLPAARLEECWKAVTGGQPREVDWWSVNGTAGCFVQLAGAGMDAAIIRETTWESKKRLGPLSYVLSGFRLLGRRAPRMRVEAPELPAPLEGTVVLIGNGRHYGGPFPLFPEAVPGDGRLDVVVMPHHGLREFYAVGRAIMGGRYQPRRGVHYFQTGQLRIMAEGGVPVPWEVDGELAGTAAELDIRHGGKVMVMGP